MDDQKRFEMKIGRDDDYARKGRKILEGDCQTFILSFRTRKSNVMCVLSVSCRDEDGKKHVSQCGRRFTRKNEKKTHTK